MHAIEQVDRPASYSLWTGDVGVALYLRRLPGWLGRDARVDVL